MPFKYPFLGYVERNINNITKFLLYKMKKLYIESRWRGISYV